MGLTSTVCGRALLLLAVPLLSVTLESADAQSISKQDMCTSLRSLANSITLSGCTINSDCTCLSCTANIPEIGNIPMTVCIVDPCTIPVCFQITAASLFTRTLCATTVINFSFQSTVTVPFVGSTTINVPVSVTVELVQRPPSKIQLTITARISTLTIEIASTTLCIYCPPPPPTTPLPTTTLPTIPPTTNISTSTPPTSPTTKPPRTPTIKPSPSTPPTVTLPTTPAPTGCGKEKQTQNSLKKLAGRMSKNGNPSGNCRVNESTFQVLCSFRYTKRSRRGNGETIHANISLTFDPCCPKMAVLLAIRDSRASAAPLVLSKCYNQTSSTAVDDSQVGSSLSAKVSITFNRKRKTIKFNIKSSRIIFAKAQVKLFWMNMPCTCPPTATPTPTVLTISPSSTLIQSSTMTPTPSSVPTLPPKGLEDMCASLRTLTSAFESSDTVTGSCTISESCLDVNCSLQIQTEGGTTLPVALSVTLLPCQSPFAIDVEAETTVFGQTFSLTDGTYSSSANVPVRIFIVSGTISIDITQEDCGILLSVTGDFGSFGAFSLLENGRIIMYCSST